MATRIHPSFDPKDPQQVQALERLAGVPAGTYAHVRAYRAEANRLGLEDPEAGYRHWASIQGTPTGRLDGFLSFGWGRPTPRAERLLEALGHDPICGSIEDAPAAGDVLEAQGIARADVETVALHRLGVTWH